MINTGEIAKKDLLKLWSQKEFDQHMPNNDLKEFIIQVLVHLDMTRQQEWMILKVCKISISSYLLLIYNRRQ
jgi:hypothetical protein